MTSLRLAALFLVGLGTFGWSLVGVDEGRFPPLDSVVVADTVFRHALHSAVPCSDCHSMQSGHGTLKVRDVSDCRSCHHAAERVQVGCAACHDETERDVVYSLERIVTLSVRDGGSERTLVFEHADHEGQVCADCHTEGPSLAVPDLDCSGCHEEHHAPDNSGCMKCHDQPESAAHPLEVHASCSGSGCHVDAPFAAVPPTRVGCLWCHEARADHEPGRECVVCHLVAGTAGPPEPPGGGHG